MQTLQRPPEPGLEPWVHSYRRYRFEAGDPGILTLLPGTGAELWLGADGGPGLLCPRRRILRVARPAGSVFAVRFHAGALPQLCRLPLAEMVDQVTPPERAWPEVGDGWARMGTADFDAQCEVASRFLRARLRPEPELERMRLLARKMFADSAGFALGEHAAGTGEGRFGLSRRFHASQGVTAKLFHRLCRFERFLRDAAFQPRPSLAGLAWEHGYCDQSHLHRDALAFGGQPPARLLRDPALPLFYSPLSGAQASSSPERWPSKG
ncbi:hypothetical protein [Chromobacterium phragmitis]|uniref:HTH araC/xylS-type domain-containing protein n=1 Tax=Chromobacterium phragmitis TaxID=2202141 RepID=A0ABV0IVX7_9NEIS